ncbi:hypothetical protein, partial [Plasmodium yoelii yoelii]
MYFQRSIVINMKRGTSRLFI